MFTDIPGQKYFCLGQAQNCLVFISFGNKINRNMRQFLTLLIVILTVFCCGSKNLWALVALGLVCCRINISYIITTSFRVGYPEETPDASMNTDFTIETIILKFH